MCFPLCASACTSCINRIYASFHMFYIFFFFYSDVLRVFKLVMFFGGELKSAAFSFSDDVRQAVYGASVLLTFYSSAYYFFLYCFISVFVFGFFPLLSYKKIYVSLSLKNTCRVFIFFFLSGTYCPLFCSMLFFWFCFSYILDFIASLYSVFLIYIYGYFCKWAEVFTFTDPLWSSFLHSIPSFSGLADVISLFLSLSVMLRARARLFCLCSTSVCFSFPLWPSLRSIPLPIVSSVASVWKCRKYARENRFKQLSPFWNLRFFFLLPR